MEDVNKLHLITRTFRLGMHEVNVMDNGDLVIQAIDLDQDDHQQVLDLPIMDEQDEHQTSGVIWLSREEAVRLAMFLLKTLWD